MGWDAGDDNSAAPGPTEEVPQRLVDDIHEMVGEIRVGLTPEELQARYEQLHRGLDHGHLVALQPYWRELLVIAIVTKGIEEVEVLTADLRAVIEALRMPSGANEKAREALDFGLRASWIQALAQAIAVPPTRMNGSAGGGDSRDRSPR